MFGKGRRLFSIASAALVVAGCLLAAVQLQPAPADLALTALHAAMRAYEIDLGFSPAPIMSLFESFGIGTGVLLVWVGLIAVIVLAALSATASRRLGATASWAGVLATVFVLHAPGVFLSPAARLPGAAANALRDFSFAASRVPNTTW